MNAFGGIFTEVTINESCYARDYALYPASNSPEDVF